MSKVKITTIVAFIRSLPATFMDHTYTESEIEFAHFIKTNSPRKIWWDFTKYVLDYGDFFYQIECVGKFADSPNENEEAIIGQLTKQIESFVPGEYAKLVCENKTIEEIFIVRAFLYFTPFREITPKDKFIRKSKQFLKTLLTGKSNPIDKIFTDIVEGCEIIICHPESGEAKAVDSNFSNLIDCGLLIQIENKCLKAFVENNGYGFLIYKDKFFHEIKELKRIAGQYEFIKV